jgi:hypothetical protein
MTVFTLGTFYYSVFQEQGEKHRVGDAAIPEK